MLKCELRRGVGPNAFGPHVVPFLRHVRRGAASVPLLVFCGSLFASSWFMI